MVDFGPHSFKIVMSFFGGLLGSLYGVVQAWVKYAEYKGVEGLGSYYNLWNTIIRNNYLDLIIKGFVIGLVIVYAIYSLFQKKEETIETSFSPAPSS